jgi:hypothetical protein
MPNKPLPKWEWTLEAELAFWTFKKAFTEALILQHSDPAKPLILQADAAASQSPASSISMTGSEL